MTSQTKDRAGSPSAGGLSSGRLLLAAAACALALAAAASAFVFERRASSAEPKLVIVASTCLVNVCPGSKRGGRTHLTAEGYKPSCKASYSWSVDGGSIVGKGPEVDWDLTDTKPGVGGRFYDARVSVECDGRRVVSSPKRVFVWDCPAPAPTPQPPNCPTVTLHCPALIKADERARFGADIAGVYSFVPTLNWTLTAGEVVEGQGTGSILVDPKGAEGRTIRVTVGVKDFGKRCGASCETRVAPAPTPTPVEPERYTLRVSVVSARDRKSSVSGARVSLYLGPTLLAEDEPADAKGIFTREALAPGTYRVRVNAERFAQGDTTVSLPRDSGRLVVFPLTPRDVPPNNGKSNNSNSNNANSNNSNGGANENTVPGVGAFNGDTNNNRRPSPTPTPDKKFLPLWLPAALVVAAALGVGAFLALKSFGTVGAAASKGAGGFAAAGVTKKADQVFCTVFGPKSAPPGGGFMMQVYAHLKKHADELDARAAEAYAEAPKRFTSSKSMGQEIKRGTELFFRLEMPGLTVRNPEQTLTWIGEIDSASFVVDVPDDFKPGVVTGLVYYGTVNKKGERVERNHIVFQFPVAAAAQASAVAPARLEQTDVPHKQAFISYAHEEAEEVFTRVQGIQAAGIKCVMDKTTFATGEDWAAAIPRLINESDVFYLCWSRKASKSKWVLKEIEFAMDKFEATHLKPAIRPLPLEPPSLVEPYEKLGDKHFDDPVLAFIDAERFRKLMRRLFSEQEDAEAAAAKDEGDAQQR